MGLPLNLAHLLSSTTRLATAPQRLARLIAEEVSFLKPSDPDEAGRFVITDNWSGRRYLVSLKPIPDEAPAPALEEAA